MRNSSNRTGRAADTGPDAPPGSASSPPLVSSGPDASPDARGLAAAILEVLAGLQTPSGAARGLGLSLARYYQLEARALEGLVSACESRRRGRQPGSELAELRRECERLRRDCARQQALVRATRRAVGLAEPPPAAPPPAESRPRRRRRPTARALKVVARLRAAEDASPPLPAGAASVDESGPAAPAATS
jgi:hypothetical protein